MWEAILYTLSRYGITLLRASTILGALFFLFWVWQPKWTQRRRIHQFIKAKSIHGAEIVHSIISLSWYMIPIFLVIVVAQKYGYTRNYREIETYGWGYWFLSIAIFFVWYDTAFYWLHRLMHITGVFRISHAIHHKSLNISPLSAYSFDPIEGFINMTPYLIYVFVVPWHTSAIIWAGSLGIAANGYIHLGYELLPKDARNHPILNWIYSAEHHLLHHQRFDCNYANYFTFWDKLMGTERLIDRPELAPITGGGNPSRLGEVRVAPALRS